MPSLDILSKIKKLNHNGYGFVSTDHFHKGLDYHTFLRHLSEVGDDEDCIIHFRLATHGSICRANCHPFTENGIYFAHNGTPQRRQSSEYESCYALSGRNVIGRTSLPRNRLRHRKHLPFAARGLHLASDASPRRPRTVDPDLHGQFQS